MANLDQRLGARGRPSGESAAMPCSASRALIQFLCVRSTVPCACIYILHVLPVFTIFSALTCFHEDFYMGQPKARDPSNRAC